MSARKVRVGVVGVGNCASSFVQGLSYYGEARSNEPPPGIMNVELGGYHIGDVEIASAFDVAATKVGRDVSHAIFAKPNNTHRFADVPELGVKVRRGPTLDGLGRYVRGEIAESDEVPVNVAEELDRTGTDVVVSYLPVGSQAATEYYAEQALEAGCAFVNCVPVFIASDPKWAKRFADKRLPIVGDDIKSGDGVRHRALIALRVQLAQQRQRFFDRIEVRGEVAGNTVRVKSLRVFVVLQQLLVSDAKERATQRGEYRELVVGPFDRQQRRAKRFNLFTVVKRLTPDEEMPHAARFERLHVRPRNVVAVTDEAPEENADVPRFEWNSLCRVSPLCNRPVAVVYQPIDKRPDGVRQGLFDRFCRDVALRVRLWHRQRDD